MTSTTWRHEIPACVAAFLFAGLVPALVVAWLGGSVRLLPFAFGLTLGHAIVLGLPVFLFFRAKRWVNPFSSTGVGFVVGAVPGGVLTWPLRPGIRGSASIDGVLTQIDGIPTVAGWLKYGEFLILLGAFGALAGLVFWLTLKLTGASPTTGKAGDDGSQPPDYRALRARSGMALAITAIVLSGGVMSIPSITKDRTCHNMFRDGRTSIGPQVDIELQLAIDDWPRFTKFLQNFSVAHQLSFRDTSQTKPGIARILALSLCNDRGINIEVIDQRWASRHFEPLIAGRGTSIPVYEVHEHSGWERLARDLVEELEAAWPGKVQFRGRDGRVIQKPRALQGSDRGEP
jgi:hypothetical protein